MIKNPIRINNSAQLPKMMDNNLPVQGTNGEKSKENTKPKGKRDFIFQDIKGNEIELEFEYGT